MFVFIRSALIPAVALAFLGATGPAQPDKFFPALETSTAEGWRQYVSATEQRIDRELKASAGFLVADFMASAAADRQAILSGQMPVAQMSSVGSNGQTVEVPDGWVHHWRGAVLVRGVKLDQVFQRLKEAVPGVGKGDVVAAQILARNDPQMQTFIKIRRAGEILWVSYDLVYNTYHSVAFARRTGTRGTSTSTATKIAELYHPGFADERELAPGKDNRFLQRWNSYWRYEEVPAGVIVECESITLSRPGPLGIGRGFADGTARESMLKALINLRGHFATSSQRPHVSSPVR